MFAINGESKRVKYLMKSAPLLIIKTNHNRFSKDFEIWKKQCERFGFIQTGNNINIVRFKKENILRSKNVYFLSKDERYHNDHII